jgi:predicted O-methyltransferase YrrM
MQNEEWMRTVHIHYPDADIRLALGPDEWRKLGIDGKYDLIFVDGHGDSRPECMEWAKNHTDLIIAHDTEHPYYCWDRADMSGFKKTEYKEMSPWTTVWERECV